LNYISEDGKFEDKKRILGRLERQNEREKGEGEHSAILP
jgi:hypothetical protein